MSIIGCAILDALHDAGLRDEGLVAASKRVLTADSIIVQTVRELVSAGVEGDALWQAAEKVELAIEAEKPRRAPRYVAPRTKRYGPAQPPHTYWSPEKQRAYDYAAEFFPTEEHSRLRDKEWWPLVGRVFRRDEHTCTYCGASGDEYILHCDHIVPIARGGSNDIENLTTACEYCNCSKRHSMPAEWCDMPAGEPA